MSASNPYDLSEGRKGFKSGMREHCQCQYCEHQRQEEAQGPRPRWLQREFDAARKATAPPAAGPWIKIEPGCEMPKSGGAWLLATKGGLYCIGWPCGPRHSGVWALEGGYIDNAEVTHRARLRMPEAE